MQVHCRISIVLPQTSLYYSFRDTVKIFLIGKYVILQKTLMLDYIEQAGLVLML